MGFEVLSPQARKLEEEYERRKREWSREKDIMTDFTAYDQKQDERTDALQSRIRQLEDDFKAVGLVQGKTTLLVAAHDERLKKLETPWWRRLF